jgi:hypothetical protein
MSADLDAAALREEIAHTRAELGETVEALAAKVDVKKRAGAAAQEMKSRAEYRVRNARTRLSEVARRGVYSGPVRTALIAGLGIGVAAVAVVQVARGRRRRRSRSRMSLRRKVFSK